MRKLMQPLRIVVPYDVRDLILREARRDEVSQGEVARKLINAGIVATKMK